MNKTNWYTITGIAIMFGSALLFWLFVGWQTYKAFGSDVGIETRIPWNCENMKLNPHPIPVSINNENGNWDVVLADGSVLTGTWLDGNFMKWVWQDATWMTDGYNVVYCESDAKAISILLAQ